jgi:hypothetical protein
LGGGVQLLTLDFFFFLFAGGGAGFQVRASWMKALLLLEREKVRLDGAVAWAELPIIGHEITRNQQTVNRQPNGFCGCPKSQKAND